MAEVVSFTSFRPPPRFDGLAWAQVRIYEAATEIATGTIIDTVDLDPTDVDPTHPLSRSFTTQLGTAPSLWYYVDFVDEDGDLSLPTEPVQNVLVDASATMTGAEILDAILSESFEQARRADALTWANAELGTIWNAEEWTFRQGTATVAVTAGSHVVGSLPDDYLTALELFRADGAPLVAVDEYRDFAARYLNGGSAAGLPEAYCGQYGTLSVGPASSETSSAYTLVYERSLALLGDDSRECALPAEAHMAVVFGAKRFGYLGSDAAAAALAGQGREMIVAGLARSYLRAARGTATQQPAYRPC